jgi:hypothetical protein
MAAPRRSDQEDITISRSAGRSLTFIAVLAFTVTARESLLRGLAGRLRGTGVGVRTTWTEKATSAPPKAPTLAPLRGFPTRAASSRERRSVDVFFKEGAFEDAALIAVRGTLKGKGSVARELPRLWRRAAPSRRVFIAFSRRDLAAATAVRRALEREGYVCFTYIHGRSKNPWGESCRGGTVFPRGWRAFRHRLARGAGEQGRPPRAPCSAAREKRRVTTMLQDLLLP